MERGDRDGRRFYLAPNGEYESTTEFLGRVTDKSKIDEWRKRVGDEYADAHTSSASFRGNEVHDLAEKFLLNKKPKKEDHSRVNRYTFEQAKPILRKHVTEVNGTEIQTWSDNLKLGGTFDCLCKWDGELAIMDFKTSGYVKDKIWIEHYFLQATIYALMVAERVGIMPLKIVIVFIPTYDSPVYYEENPLNYLDRLYAIIHKDRSNGTK